MRGTSFAARWRRYPRGASTVRLEGASWGFHGGLLRSIGKAVIVLVVIADAIVLFRVLTDDQKLANVDRDRRVRFGAGATVVGPASTIPTESVPAANGDTGVGVVESGRPEGTGGPRPTHGDGSRQTAAESGTSAFADPTVSATPSASESPAGSNQGDTAEQSPPPEEPTPEESADPGPGGTGPGTGGDTGGGSGSGDGGGGGGG